MKQTHANRNARPGRPRRAFSLLEMTLVIALIGLISGAAVMRFGHAALNTTNGEGFTRRVMLDLRQAKRRAISTGDNHYVQFHRTSGVVTSFALYRDGGDQVDDTRVVPTGIAVSTGQDTWEFEFDGTKADTGSSSNLVITGSNYSWTVYCYHATGSVEAVQASL